MKQTLQDSGVIRFSSPPRGSLISISNLKNNKTTYWQCSRPLHGVLLSQYREECANGDVGQVLVPSTGFSYLNIVKNVPTVMSVKFSSPPRGSLISIWLEKSIRKQDMKIVLVPSTGFSYLNSVPCSHPPFQFSSRPLHGVLLSQYCPLHLLKHRAFIPHLRGKPANERNLNIKLVYNIHKAWF